MVFKDSVISEQPMGLTEVKAPSSVSKADTDGLQCEEPNNNTNKPPPPAPSSHTAEQGQAKSTEELSHNALQLPDTTPPRAETAKRHSLKLRERIFQFPLCEKALAFNLPAQNKSKILPMAQYNCCRVL